MGKFAALWQLFKVGNAVADPAAWKRRQITVTALAAVVLALVQVVAAFGYQLPVDPDAASAIAGGVIAVVNVVLTLTTSDKVGIARGDAMQPDDSTAPGSSKTGGASDGYGGA
jgi:hypothetical protein